MENWEEIKTAFQVARMGTVSGAAEVLGVHHATVIRHIDALESRLGVKLFQRHARGYNATEAGQDLMRVAQATDDQFNQLAGRIKGRGNEVSGELVVTSLVDIASRLSPILAEFQQAYPNVVIRYLTGERLFRLEYGEAHVAIRAGTVPDQPDNVVQRFHFHRFGLYASPDYIEKYGKPNGVESFPKHRFVAKDEEDTRAPFERWLRQNVPAECLTFKSSDSRALRAAILAGAGIGFLPSFEATLNPQLAEVHPASGRLERSAVAGHACRSAPNHKGADFPEFSQDRCERMGRLTLPMRGHLAMLLFSALVAGSFSLGAQVANEIPPLALNAVRFWLAAAVIWLVAQATGGLPRHAMRAPWRYFVLGGLFGVYFVLMFEGLKTAPPVSAAAVFTLTPILTAGLGWVLLSQRTTPRMATALAIGGLGALWVVFRADFAALKAFAVGRGEAIYFVGCFAHALYTPLARKMNRGETAIIFTLGTLIGGGVVLTVFGWRDLVATQWAALPALVWITLFYLAVFASAASVWLLQIATLRLPAAKVMAYTYLVPTWVICWEIAQGNEMPAPHVLGGVIMTVVALGLLLRDEEPPAGPMR